MNLRSIASGNYIRNIDIVLINRSDSVLLIKKAYWAVLCGLNYSQEPVWKGDTIHLRYFCHPQRSAHFDKTSLIITNFGKMTVNFTGTVLDRTIKTDNIISLKTNPRFPDVLTGKIRLSNKGVTSYSVFPVSKTKDTNNHKIIDRRFEVSPGALLDVQIPFTITKEALAENNHFQLGYQLGDKTGVIDYYMKED